MILQRRAEQVCSKFMEILIGITVVIAVLAAVAYFRKLNGRKCNGKNGKNGNGKNGNSLVGALKSVYKAVLKMVPGNGNGNKNGNGNNGNNGNGNGNGNNGNGNNGNGNGNDNGGNGNGGNDNGGGGGGDNGNDDNDDDDSLRNPCGDDGRGLTALLRNPGGGQRALPLRSDQADEIRFWSPQMKEHALFLMLGLQPTGATIMSPLMGMPSSEPSTVSQVPLQVQVNTTMNAELIQNMKDTATKLFDAWSQFETELSSCIFHLSTFVSLIQQLQGLKIRVRDLQRSGVWIGWLFPDFLPHVLMELEHFVRRFQDEVTPDQERAFWTHMNADHAAFAAHLLNTDSGQTRELVSAALALADEGHASLPSGSDHSQHEAAQAILLSSRMYDDAEYAQRVTAFNETAWNDGNPQVLSVIHPILLAHVVREGRRSLQRLRALGEPENPATRKIYNRLARHIPRGINSSLNSRFQRAHRSTK